MKQSLLPFWSWATKIGNIYFFLIQVFRQGLMFHSQAKNKNTKSKSTKQNKKPQNQKILKVGYVVKGDQMKTLPQTPPEGK